MRPIFLPASILIVLIKICLFSCTPSEKNTTEDSVTSKVIVKDSTTATSQNNPLISIESECDPQLLRLLRSSNFNPLKIFKEELSFQIEDASADIIQIRAYTISDLDKRVTLGWITIDVDQQLLWDITNDPDHPVELAYDAVAFSNFKNCWVSKRSNEFNVPYGD